MIASYSTRVEFNHKAATQGTASRHTGNNEWRTCPRSLHGGYNGIWTQKAPNATTEPHVSCMLDIV